MTKNEIERIRRWLIENIFRNENAMYNDNIREVSSDCSKDNIDMIDIISSLYNLLHKEVTGELYDYMFHWANKVGSDTDEHIFDNIMKEGDLYDYM